MGTPASIGTGVTRPFKERMREGHYERSIRIGKTSECVEASWAYELAIKKFRIISFYMDGRQATSLLIIAF